MPNSVMSSLTVPVDVSGTITNVTFDIKDATARQMIHDLGNALYWMGVTTTVLEEDATTNPITIGGESVTANVGGMAQYDGEEFVWNGSAWQSMGKANFGSLAFKDSASGNFTPQGAVTITEANDTTDTVVGVSTNGTIPSFTTSGETLIFNAGAMPTLDSEKTFVTASGTRTATFAGTEGTVTVS